LVLLSIDDLFVECNFFMFLFSANMLPEGFTCARAVLNETKKRNTKTWGKGTKNIPREIKKISPAIIQRSVPRKLSEPDKIYSNKENMRVMW
jgi:hypothetical protein